MRRRLLTAQRLAFPDKRRPLRGGRARFENRRAIRDLSRLRGKDGVGGANASRTGTPQLPEQAGTRTAKMPSLATGIPSVGRATLTADRCAGRLLHGRDHLLRDLRDFGIDYPQTDDQRERRAISWKYQYELVKATPLPDNLLTVRFEDFILKQEETLERLEEFLGFSLGRIIARSDPIGRWKTDSGQHYFDFFKESMLESGYAEGLV